MEVIPTAFPGVLLIKPRMFRDQRGFFMETFHDNRYRELGIDCRFVQDNLSRSSRGTLRGLHYQKQRPQAKLVQAIVGEIFDVAVDVRPGSPFFGRWVGERLTGDNGHQLYIPEGFAHGFCVLSDEAVFIYKCTDFYAPEDEGGVLWSDPDLAIEWPVSVPVLSEKNRSLPLLQDLGEDDLPQTGVHR
ncbi:dTDP-4-dehydrorhamnose 3,5-epimerase (EC [Olavius algarvensis associated proteobacterium Delta 3]|nr:dTDP-4-dehydrorhamnose 3,5-epimerase (EC [Olavius algarvensis associated proteobacterium Delta 3]